jgi:biotin transporter BioY
MEFLFVWLVCAILVGVFAHGRRNRNGMGWFLLAALISPLLAGLLVACMSTRDPWAA